MSYQPVPPYQPQAAPAPASEVSVLGVISLIVGIPGALLGLIPCCGMIVSIPATLVGLLMGVIGLLVAMKNERQSTSLPIAGIAASLVGLLINGVWLGIGFVAAREAEKQKQANILKVQQSPGTPITAEELYQAYQDNSLNADSKYKDQVLLISGVVESVTDGISEVTVSLEVGEDEFDSIECEFETTEKLEVNPLMPGDEVTIRGLCQGQQLLDITLKFCQLQAKP